MACFFCHRSYSCVCGHRMQIQTTCEEYIDTVLLVLRGWYLSENEVLGNIELLGLYVAPPPSLKEGVGKEGRILIGPWLPE